MRLLPSLRNKRTAYSLRGSHRSGHFSRSCQIINQELHYGVHHMITFFLYAAGRGSCCSEFREFVEKPDFFHERFVSGTKPRFGYAVEEATMREERVVF
jgi:hypothetical protein